MVTIIFIILICLFIWTAAGVKFYIDIEPFKDYDKKLNFKGFLLLGPIGWLFSCIDYLLHIYIINKDFFLKDK